MQVPCGKCLGCLKKKQSDLAIRVSEEMDHSSCAVFLTLTYSDEHVPKAFDPETGEMRLTLKRSDFQNWMKLLREYLHRDGFDRKVSMFCCGEYGSRTFRPHFHCVLTNVNQRIIQKALDNWRDRFGFYNIQDVGLSALDRSHVGLYVGKYSSKGVYSNQSPLMVDFIEKPFIESSKFLGRKWIEERVDFFSLIGENHQYEDFDDFVQDFLENFRYRKNGYDYSLPRYYKDYFFKHTPAGWYENIVSKTHESVLDYKPSFSKCNVQFKDETKKIFVSVPSLRDRIALSVQARSDVDYLKRAEELCKQISPDEVARQLACEQLSSAITTFKSTERKLESSYLASRV